MAKPKLLTVTEEGVAAERAIRGIVRRVAAEPRDRRQARVGRKLAKAVLAQAQFKHGDNMNHYVPWTIWDELVALAREFQKAKEE